MHTYEIRPREAGEHRPGHFELLIDGVGTEVTCDPAQFMPRALREALAAGKPPGEQATKAAQVICANYAARSLERRIARLRAGQLPGKPGMDAGTAAQVASRKRATEKEAVAAFLHRGTLKGLDNDQRKKRAKRRAEKRDHEAEWRERRAKLIALREADLKHWQEQQAKGNPKAERNVNNLRIELAALKAPVLAASHGFQYAFGQYLTKAVDLVNDDVRIIPLMTNTTVDTERDAKDSISDFTTLDAFDGANAAANGHALDSQAVNIDDANDRAEFDAADEVASALGAGTRSIQGILLFSFITNLNSSLPLHWIEFSSNKTPDGSDFTFVFNAEGILQAA